MQMYGRSSHAILSFVNLSKQIFGILRTGVESERTRNLEDNTFPADTLCSGNAKFKTNIDCIFLVSHLFTKMYVDNDVRHHSSHFAQFISVKARRSVLFKIRKPNM